jgi:hypothetical protein
VLAIANGTPREAMLVPALGKPSGLVLSVAARSALILAVAYAALPWLGRTSAAGYAAIGLGWLCPSCPQHAGISKQAAVFCKKARKELHSPGTAGRAERAESPTPKVLRAVAKSLARSAVMRFFCFFLFTKRRPSLPACEHAAHRVNSAAG